MTADAVLAAGVRPAEAPPALTGWAGAASAIHSIRQMAMPMTLALDLAGHPTIRIDFAFHAFAWAGELAELPADPVSVLVETRPAIPDQPSIELPGRGLDPLLWTIGWHAFGDEPAPWLRAGDRYRLRRWPSLSEVDPTLDQVRMIAMLGNAFATADELAAAARTPPADARRLVNAFAVLGILRRSAGAPALEAIAPAPEAVSAGAPDSRGTGGLLGRLRERWGR